MLLKSLALAALAVTQVWATRPGGGSKCEREYVVKKNDGCRDICSRNGLTMDELRDLNPSIFSGNNCWVRQGDKLCFGPPPGRPTTTAKTAAKTTSKTASKTASKTTSNPTTTRCTTTSKMTTKTTTKSTSTTKCTTTSKPTSTTKSTTTTQPTTTTNCTTTSKPPTTTKSTTTTKCTTTSKPTTTTRATATKSTTTKPGTTTKCTTTSKATTTTKSATTKGATTGKDSTRRPHPHPTTRRQVTSTVYSTTIQTITSCAPGVRNCPGHVVTRTIAVSTTICPATTNGPEPTHPGGGAGWPKPSDGPSRGPGPNSWGPKPSVTNAPFSTVTIPKGQDRPASIPHHVGEEPASNFTGDKPTGAGAPAGPGAPKATDRSAGHVAPQATSSAPRPVVTAGASRNGAATFVFSGAMALTFFAL